MRKYFEMLGVNANTDESDLKYALKEKLKAEDCILVAEMLPYVEAYVVLSNPKEKERYLSMKDEEYSFADRHPSVKDPESVSYDIEHQLRIYNEKISAKWIPAIMSFLGSLAVLLAGIGITYLSYISAEEGERYSILYGLIIVGFFATIKSFFGILVVREEKLSAPDKMWMSVNVA